MKTRDGFVSNSSSSSFCVLGAGFDSAMNVFETFKKANGPLYLEFVEAVKQKMIDDESTEEQIRSSIDPLIKFDEDHWEYYEMIWELERFLDSKGIELSIISGECVAYAGRDYQNIGDDETGSEFAKSTKEWLTTVFGEVSISHICEVVSSG